MPGSPSDPPPSPPDPLPTAELIRLLAAARRVTGLHVILRDLSGRSGLPPAWLYHDGPACRRARGGRSAAAAGCADFCAGSVLRELAASGGGRVHACPFGLREVAVPVHSRERFLGVLFAGPLAADAPGDDLRLLLEALALRCAQLLDGAAVRGATREARIVAWIEAGLARPLALAGLAAHLGLSPSRCGHHLKELFGLTFPALVRRQRMQAAARLLAGCGAGVAEVARRVGYRDAERFARHFRAVHGAAPRAWRSARA